MNKKKKRKGFDRGGMRCPYCGSPVVYRSADGIYRDNSKGTMLYVCSRYLYIRRYFQIGCIGLCKAAATDKGGTFSTYAYRLIWNEICDALIYSTRRQAAEFSSDMIPLVAEEPTVSIADVATQLDVQAALKAAKQEASPCVVKGIDAMIQMTKGRSSKEIGNEFGVSANLVCAWVSKARKYLKSRPEILALAET